MYRQRVSKNQPISARAWNNLLDEVNRQAKITAAPPLEVTDTGGGLSLRWVDTAIWAKLGEIDNGAQAWVEVTPDGIGGWSELNDGRSGTVVSNSAFEINDRPAPENTIVRIVPGFGEEYVYANSATDDKIRAQLVRKTPGFCPVYKAIPVKTANNCTFEQNLDGPCVSTLINLHGVDHPVCPPPSPLIGTPSLVEDDEVSEGEVEWDLPSAADITGLRGRAYASVTLQPGETSRRLILTRCCHLLPDTVGPDDVEVTDVLWTVTVSADGEDVNESEVKLVVGGTVVGSSKHTGTDLDTEPEERDYSGSPSSWGHDPLLVSEVNADDYGLSLKYTNNFTPTEEDDGVRTVRVDAAINTLEFYPEGVWEVRAVFEIYQNDNGYWMFDDVAQWEHIQLGDETAEQGGVTYTAAKILRYDQTTKQFVEHRLVTSIPVN